jgi:F0F1-type ATP synthase membrane subunit b/b'
LLEDIELIHVAESLADEILDEAKLRVETIQKETEAKQAQDYTAVYDAEITAAKRNSEEIAVQARTDAENEANAILRQAEKRVTTVKETGRKNFEAAVNAIIAEILV